MSEKKNYFIENLAVLASPEGIQKYVFGTKKNGQPRAVYDLVRDFVPGMKKDKSKKKKKHKGKPISAYDFYVTSKKKNKKHKKKNKYWHI